MFENFLSIPDKINFQADSALLFLAAAILIITCIKLIISKNLLESVAIMSVFSLFIGICYLFMDAPDVAMTETALGACLSTCVLLNLVRIFGEEITTTKRFRTSLALALCLIFIATLTWASLDLPSFGQEDSPLQTHLTKYYIENTKYDIAIPSIVAAILASYRGFDTLGETAVILIAGLAVLTILSSRKKNAEKL
jgi:multicomponent Na+:H+ antiporter subunit B